MDPFVGMIALVGFNFAPSGWALCDGRLLSIAENDVLFNLIGTTYGGNGQNTFALPDLQGRIPVHMGGAGGYVIGQRGGTESHTLTQSNMPSHTHSILINTAAGATGIPSSATYLAAPFISSGPNATPYSIFNTNTPDTALAPQVVSSVGQSQPFNLLQPFLVMNYSISLFGVYPSQN
jgi:microcystin-dependent protein